MIERSEEKFFRRRYPAVGLVVFFSLGLILGRNVFFLGYWVVFLLIALLCIASVFFAVSRLARTRVEPDVILTAIAWIVLLLFGQLLSPQRNFVDYRFPDLVYEVEGVISAGMFEGDSALLFLDDVSIGGQHVEGVKVVVDDVNQDMLFSGVRISFIGSVIAVNPTVLVDCRSGLKVRSCEVAFKYLPNIFRDYLKIGIKKATDEKAAGLISAVTLGVRDELAPDWYGAFTRSGNGHLLAVSGLHTGLICFIAFFLASFITISPRLRWFAALLVCLVFMVVVGFNPPVVRATVMVLATFSAYALGRRRNSINALFFAVFAIIIIDPSSLFSPSLHLSASAILGIVILGIPLSERIRRKNILDSKMKVLGLFLLRASCISMSAWAFTTPLVAYYFGSVNPFSFLYALITIPLLSLLVGASLLLIVTYLISGGAFVIGLPAAISAHILGLVNVMLDNISGSLIEIASPSCIWVLFAIALMVWGGIMLRTRYPYLAMASFVVVALSALLPPNVDSGCFELGEGHSRIVAVSDGESSMVFYSGRRNFRYLKCVLAANRLPPAKAIVRTSCVLREIPADVKDREFFPLYSKTHSENIYFKGAKIIMGDISAECLSPPNYSRIRFGTYLFPSTWRVKLKTEEIVISD